MIKLKWPNVRSLTLLLGAWLLLWSAPQCADPIGEDAIKAGFILNFAKFTTWPATALSVGDLRVCGLGPQPLGGRLKEMQGRPVQNRQVEAREGVRDAQWRDCHVLFIPAAEADRADAVVRALASAPVLTVSDAPGFVRAGGMIGLKQRGGRIRFDVNLAAIRRAGLDFSSQPLRLADEVLQ